MIIEHKNLFLSLLNINSPTQRKSRLQTYIDDTNNSIEDFKDFFELFSQQEEIKRNQGLAAIVSREKSNKKIKKKTTYDSPFFSQTHFGENKCRSCGELITSKIAFIWKIDKITNYYHPNPGCFPKSNYDKFDNNFGYNNWIKSKK